MLKHQELAKQQKEIAKQQETNMKNYIMIR